MYKTDQRPSCIRLHMWKETCYCCAGHGRTRTLAAPLIILHHIHIHTAIVQLALRLRIKVRGSQHLFLPSTAEVKTTTA